MPHLDLQRTRHVSLCEALDRLLQTGVMAMGEVMLSVADVDMLCVRLQLVISAVDSLRITAPELVNIDRPPHAAPALGDGSLVATREYAATPPASAALPEPPAARAVTVSRAGPDEDARNAQALGKLVLTVIKLLHDLLELQALHRIEAGSLTPAQIERLGTTLMRQTDAIERLRKEFGLENEELNLDLGPLGKLL